MEVKERREENKKKKGGGTEGGEGKRRSYLGIEFPPELNCL